MAVDGYKREDNGGSMLVPLHMYQECVPSPHQLRAQPGSFHGRAATRRQQRSSVISDLGSYSVLPIEVRSSTHWNVRHWRPQHAAYDFDNNGMGRSRAMSRPSFTSLELYDTTSAWREKSRQTMHRNANQRANMLKRENNRYSRASIQVLFDWLDEHQKNPYPDEIQKTIFSQTTGLSLTQINNWFINRRRRRPAA